MDSEDCLSRNSPMLLEVNVLDSGSLIKSQVEVQFRYLKSDESNVPFLLFFFLRVF